MQIKTPRHQLRPGADPGDKDSYSQLYRIHETTENIHASDGLPRIVIFFIIVPYKYPFLLTHLQGFKVPQNTQTIWDFINILHVHFKNF